jgi:hypothetical protein
VRWRDVRLEKPTKADQDEHGMIAVMFIDKSFGCHKMDTCDSHYAVAWMPLSELPKFERVPDPPEGWRFVKNGEAFDERAKVWSFSRKFYHEPAVTGYKQGWHYIVPIEPPKPKYRPFANALEFELYRNRWLKNGDTLRRVDHYSDAGVNGMTWELLLRNRTFEDGSPCGVAIRASQDN